MTKKLSALETAIKGKKIQARSKTEIEADLDEAIRWAVVYTNFCKFPLS